MKKYKIIFAIISILIVLISINFTKNFKLDASSDTLILKEDKTFKYYEYYSKIFPNKNFLVLAIKSNKQIDSDYIEKINFITDKIDNLQNIDSTFSIVDAPILLLNKLKISELNSDNIENINNTENDLNKILDEFSKSPIFSDQIINSNKNISAIIIYIKKNKKIDKLLNDKDYKIEKEKNLIEKEKLIKEIRIIINEQKDDYEYFLGGIDMIASDTINFIKNDIIIFSIAVIILIIFVLLIIYRDLKWVMIPLISTTSAVIIMIGIIGFFQWEITAISSNFISIMIILSISMNIHIINNYKINYFIEKKSGKIIITIKEMFLPCLYTVLTTIVAFGSLLLSNIKPIEDFGSIMIVALIIIFISSFTILPLLISYLPKINNNKNINFNILNKLYILSVNHSKKIILINIFILLVSVYGINKLSVENSFINYFKSNTEIYKGMKLIDQELGGTTPIDILIKFKNDTEFKNSKIDLIDLINLDNELDSNNEIGLDDELNLELELLEGGDQNNWFSKEKINTIKKIHEYLESKKEIGKTQSLHSLIMMGNLINKNELSIFELSILYEKIPNNYKEMLIDPYLSIDKNMIKISARVRDSYEIDRNNLILDINNFITNEFDNIEDFKTNGLLVLYNNMLQSLFNSQIKSFGIILIAIFFMFLILFKSIKLSFIGMIPNIIASTFILGLIGLLSIPLDIMTITIAAITIGIAVDNTIHYIYRINKNDTNIKSIKKLIESTHNNVGNAVLTTSLTIASGFSVLTLSNFIPTIMFGVFTSLAMLIAMIGVLITLPSILYKFK